MTKEQAEFLEKVSIECGNQECDIRDDYSGRSMYGKTTYGVVVSDITILLADCINYLRNEDAEDINKVPDFEEFRMDNMGRDIIIY